MTVNIQFLGAAGTVTGSQYLVSAENRKILVDCGLFQGERAWRDKNWLSPDFDLETVEALVLTHAHIDHSGLIPRYYRLGLRCPIYCSSATKRLAEIMLPDSGRLQEEEAEYREKSGKSRHKPPLPLYTEKDAVDCLSLFQEVPLRTSAQISKNAEIRFFTAGHILGARSVELGISDKLLSFSGDIGRYSQTILNEPISPHGGDLLLIESTYGTRDHSQEDPGIPLKRVILDTCDLGGVVLIPSFAVGRTQSILALLKSLKEQRAIPDIPVVVDSPMASDATEIYREFRTELHPKFAETFAKQDSPFIFPNLKFVRSVEDSKKLNQIGGPMVIISASGMLTGGRILHHLKHRVGQVRNSVVLVGHQPVGGRGYWLQHQAKQIRIMGEDLEVRAKVSMISNLSAHADRSELMRWCQGLSGSPRKVAVVHGESEVSQSFARTLSEKFSWQAALPNYKDIWKI